MARVAFVYNGSESLGLASLSAYLKAHGHKVSLAFDPAHFGGNRGREMPFLAQMFDPPPDVVARTALDSEPDILAFSCVTGNFRWALEVARHAKARRPDLPTVFGGIHPTVSPKASIAEDLVDAIVIGEGEGALLDIADSFDASGIIDPETPNIWTKQNGSVVKNPVRPYISELDSLPLPDKELFYSKVPSMEQVYMIMTSRGCPYRCTYCCNNVFPKIYSGQGGVRQRSVSSVIAELKAVRERGRAGFVAFWDDIFTLNIRWMREFAPMYRREVGLPFVCYVHPNFTGEEMVSLLALAGCETVKVGVQSVSESTLKNTLKRKGGPEKVMETFRLLKKYGIKATAEHILGLPGEDEGAQRDALELYMEARPEKVISFWLVYYPGTEITQMAKEAGNLTEEDVKGIESGHEATSYTFMFPDKSSASKSLLKYQIIFDLVPFLPKPILKWLERSTLLNRLYSGSLHQLLILINALKNRDREDLLGLKYVFSKKDTP